ncbi:hypothetical protein [Rhizobium sp. AN80A]|uniref:hypothetical protein n=1 Tax=Rhizobium sp. AN80A TaxID=3040673 RepID=UPI000DB8FE52|nr:hypothetical protein [Rhizobium sp. AN80A]
MKISTDSGKSWSDEEVVGQPAPLPDVGYPRTVVGKDGTVLAVHCTNAGKERFMVATRIRITD